MKNALNRISNELREDDKINSALKHSNFGFRIQTLPSTCKLTLIFISPEAGYNGEKLSGRGLPAMFHIYSFTQMMIKNTLKVIAQVECSDNIHI